MHLPNIVRRPLGFIRRNMVGRVLGLHFGLERSGRGTLFAVHRDPDFIKLFENCAYDAFSYWESALFRSSGSCRAALLARITAIAHGLEKGLSYQNRKHIFGIQYAQELIEMLSLLSPLTDGDPDPQVSWALSTLKEWYDYHQDKPQAGEQLLECCRKLLAKTSECPSLDNTLVLERDVVQAAAKGDFPSLARSRHSIREFSPESVEIRLIWEAVSLATRSPSACNRQSVRTVCLSQGRQMQSALALQSGNRGFSERIDKLLIVAFDMRAYLEHHERHLGYVDAGIFAMSLMHALHYLGLGACCLNWAVEGQVDHQLHQDLELPKHLAVACFIAVGNLPERLMVASSHRLSVEEVLEVRSAATQPETGLVGRVNVDMS